MDDFTVILCLQIKTTDNRCMKCHLQAFVSFLVSSAPRHPYFMTENPAESELRGTVPLWFCKIGCNLAVLVISICDNSSVLTKWPAAGYMAAPLRRSLFSFAKRRPAISGAGTFSSTARRPVHASRQCNVSSDVRSASVTASLPDHICRVSTACCLRGCWRSCR